MGAKVMKKEVSTAKKIHSVYKF